VVDLAQVIEAPIPGLDVGGANLKVRVSAAIDDHTHPMTAALQDAWSRNASAL
jgi:hypothetical protein